MRKRASLEQRVDKPVEPILSAPCAALCYLCVSLSHQTSPCDVFTRWCCDVTVAGPCLCATDIALWHFVMF